MNDTADVPAPGHFWIVAILGLVWTTFGAFDYLMINVRYAGYVDHLPAEAMQFIDTYPAWVVAAWGLAAWGGLAGAVLLLWRSRFAVHGFVLSLLGLAACTAFQLGAEVPGAMKTPAALAASLFIWAVAIVLPLYAMRMRRVGVLR